MAATMDSDGIIGIRDEFIRQQLAIAAVQLIALNNVKHAMDFKSANDKINEQNEFNNILFAISILEHEIRELNIQQSFLRLQLEKLEDAQRQENENIQRLNQKFAQDEEFFISLALEKNQLLKNQALLNKINEVNERIENMIGQFDQRISELNTTITSNNIENINKLNDIFDHLDYNKKPKIFNFGGKLIEFEKNEVTDGIQDKLSQKMEDGILTSDNLYSEMRIAYKEVIEDKAKALGLSEADYSDVLNDNTDYIDLEQQMKADPQMQEFLDALDENMVLVAERDENILQSDLLRDAQRNIRAAYDEHLVNQSDPTAFENVQDVLTRVNETINLIGALNPYVMNLDINDEEELSLDDDEDLSLGEADDLAPDDLPPDEPNGPAPDEPMAQAGPPGGPAVDYIPEEPEPNIDPNPVENNAQPQQPAAQKPKTSTGALSKMLGINLAAAKAENDAAPDKLDNQEKKSEAKQSPANAPANQADAKRDEDVRPSGPRR